MGDLLRKAARSTLVRKHNTGHAIGEIKRASESSHVNKFAVIVEASGDVAVPTRPVILSSS